MMSKRVKVSFQRREDSTSSRHCCVPLCTASAKFNSVLSFHTFPKDKELQKRWVINIRRDNFTITDHTRVCSRHFRSTDLIEPPTPAGRRRLKNGAVPVLFQWNNFSPSAPQTAIWPYSDHDYCSTAEPDALDLSLNYTEDLQAEIIRLRKHIEEITINSKFGLERFAASDDDIRFYTRFASHTHLMAFWRQIEFAAGQVMPVTTVQTAAMTDEVPHTLYTMSLQPIDEFFLFMTYLSLGLMEKDLAHRFRIHQSTVSRIILAWANFLYALLGVVSIWLDKDTIKANLPDVFQHYSDTQVVLVSTELCCQTPNSPPHTKVLSTYKPQCTFKGLIGMAPHGAVTFVSSLYEGAISDREMVKQSGIVSLLKPAMAIMVDEGFLVGDCVPCKVHMPTFQSKGAQLSGSGVMKTQSAAKLRVHVEQLIQRVKEHKIFNTVIPSSLTGSINQLYTVDCLLVNYQNTSLASKSTSRGGPAEM